MPETVTLSPPPVFFIKSISEQGYSLSTAIADLIDNSIAAEATRVEILFDYNSFPLKLFIADNGNGMDADSLTANMRFPSADLDIYRGQRDLGRFGLGLKTASFSQSRRFSVISKIGNEAYHGRTWDVEFLKTTEDWTLIVEPASFADETIKLFDKCSSNFHAHDSNFEVKTLVVWEQLYKLENQAKKFEIADEVDELRSHLGLVFHRFISTGKVQIRLNNQLLEGFEPFPEHEKGVQLVSENFWNTEDSYIRFQGIILPKRSAAEAKEGSLIWVPYGKTLDDMQGIFVYRNDRLISFGGWLKTISKSGWLQFARIRIDISNINDSQFHLNVAKSSLKLPFGLRKAMKEMVEYVTLQAGKEYKERQAAKVTRPSAGRSGLSLLTRETNGRGVTLRINPDFELIRQLETGLDADNATRLSILLQLIEGKINQLWTGEIDSATDVSEIGSKTRERMQRLKEYYMNAGYSWEEVRQFLTESFGHENAVINIIDNLT